MCKYEILILTPDFAVINKPAGLICDTFTLELDGKSYHPVHRLDIPTTGAFLLSRKDFINDFRRLFSERCIRKTYLAASSTSLPDSELHREIHGLIGGRYRKSKRTHFATEESKLKGFHSIQEVIHEIQPEDILSFPECSPNHFTYKVNLISGARHQIRAYFASQQCPIVGDTTYNGEEFSRLCLHAYELKFNCPISDKNIIVKANFS